MSLKPKINKIDSSGIFKGPLTFPCPICVSYHNSVAQVSKCLRKAEFKYDEMFRYYQNFVTTIKGEKSNGN